ncbi:MAG: YceI family protein [Thermoanaerobaculia bacterium]
MRGRKQASAVLLTVLGAVASALPARAVAYKIDPGRSTFAVLTHKAGIAAGLAHDHLIVAAAPRVSLDFDRERPEATKFSFVVAVDALEVDAPGARAALEGRLRELGLQAGDLPPVPESDRKKVRAAMLGESQLDGAKFPEIRAEVLGLERGAAPAADGKSAWTLVLQLTIRGRTLERRQPVTWSEKDGVLEAEIVAELRFKEFGIEPYSTMLGAIRNDDRFHIYVKVVARSAS